MMNKFVPGVVLSGAAALLAVAGSAFAGEITAPKFSVGLGFDAQAYVSEPGDNTPFITFVHPDVTGFTDDNDPNNRVDVFSSNGHFEGYQSFGGTYGAISTNFGSVGDLRDALNDSGGWTLRITDGVTRTVYDFAFTVDASNLGDEYLRPILLNLNNGDAIGTNPTFTWSQATTDNPDAQYVDGLVQLYSGDFANIYTSPGISPSDTSWTPNGPIANNEYSLFVGTRTAYANPDLITVNFSSSDLGGNGATIDSVSHIVGVSAFSYAHFLTVPAPGAAAVGMGAMVMGLRRRR